jgi:hypothetical protein
MALFQADVGIFVTGVSGVPTEAELSAIGLPDSVDRSRRWAKRWSLAVVFMFD